MDDLVSMIWPLVPTVIGGLLAIGGGLAGALIQSRRERRRWWDQQRLAAYVDHLTATDAFFAVAARSADQATIAATESASRDAVGRVHLFGPDAVYSAALSFQIATLDSAEFHGMIEAKDNERIVKRQAFIDASREALTAPPK